MNAFNFNMIKLHILSYTSSLRYFDKIKKIRMQAKIYTQLLVFSQTFRL